MVMESETEINRIVQVTTTNIRFYKGETKMKNKKKEVTTKGKKSAEMNALQRKALIEFINEAIERNNALNMEDFRSYEVREIDEEIIDEYTSNIDADLSEHLGKYVLANTGDVPFYDRFTLSS